MQGETAERLLMFETPLGVVYIRPESVAAVTPVPNTLGLSLVLVPGCPPISVRGGSSEVAALVWPASASSAPNGPRLVEG